MDFVFIGFIKLMNPMEINFSDINIFVKFNNDVGGTLVIKLGMNQNLKGIS